MLHFADTEPDDERESNFSLRRNSAPAVSGRVVLEKLESLQRDFLPKSLALHISLAKNKSQGVVPSNSSKPGLGLSAMMIGASACSRKTQNTNTPSEVVINVGSADPINTSGSALSETDSEDDGLWDSWKQLTGGTHSWRQR
eukprot:CAMPEP_0172214014 /NCGR_PEP_ID=MMETSP1050-20130122/37922_1 /TAXON_ID=233186 /ORGANISM="Cryptomonas curvata, Strain CCAP979/52" /LENGTH=141 /DNA_ID=CAMNT_0012894929 /DNA_START=66 /DNA_END=487 /DNA_ORIENTATION=+